MWLLYLSSYPGYFRELHWFSMGLPEISRVTWQVCGKNIGRYTGTEICGIYELYKNLRHPHVSRNTACILYSSCIDELFLTGVDKGGNFTPMFTTCWFLPQVVGMGNANVGKTCLIKHFCESKVRSQGGWHGLSHYDDAITGRDGVSDRQPQDCLLNRLSTRVSKKTSKLRVTDLCEGN